MMILPIASGKGGVGKSLIAVNLSIALAQAGKKVIVADLDLGGSNVHLILGQTGVQKGIGTYLNSQDTDFNEIVLDAEYKNLRFIPGDAEIPGTANLKTAQKQRLIKKIRGLNADITILDLGAGSNYNIVDFFLTSGRGIVVTAPTSTANLNAYLFLKNVVFRLIHSSFKKQSEAKTYLDGLFTSGSAAQRVYVPRLLATIKELDPESYESYKEQIRFFHPWLILNMLEDPKDNGKSMKLRRSCKEYLDLDIEHLGIIYRDDLQDVALNSRLPIIIYKPNSVLSQAIYRIADKLLLDLEEQEELKEPAFDLEEIDESFEEADMEAEIDFDTKMRYMEDLLGSGALTQGDLIETIKTQQFEISQLKKENVFIKSKLAKAISAGFIE